MGARSQAPQLQALTNENSNVDGKVDGTSKIALLNLVFGRHRYARRASIASDRDDSELV